MELANYRFRGRRSDDKRWMYGDLYHAGDLVCICDWSVHPQLKRTSPLILLRLAAIWAFRIRTVMTFGRVTSLKMMFCGMSEPSSEFPGALLRV